MSKTIERLNAGLAEIADISSYFYKHYKVDGKSLAEWKEHFHITLEEDMSLEVLQTVTAKLGALMQEAFMYRTAAEQSLKAIEHQFASEFDHALHNERESYASQKKKLPAKDYLVSSVNNKLADVKTALTCANLNLIFWKSVTSSLDTTRKIIESLVMSHGIQAKMFSRTGGDTAFITD